MKQVVKSLFKRGILSLDFIEEPFKIFSQPNRIRPLKDRYKGERCVIIGNGPSLNNADLKLLSNEFTFGVNSIFLKSASDDFYPTFYVVEDGAVVSDNTRAIKEFSAEYKFFPSAYRAKLGFLDSKHIYFNMNRGAYEELSPNYEKPRFSEDMSSHLFCGQSVTIINLQIAFYLGFTNVYLIGMDFQYDIPDTSIILGNKIISTGPDPNHFDPTYFGAGKTYHDPKLEIVLKSYKHCKEIYEKAGRKIYNATHGGKLEVFERVSFEETFRD